MEIGLCPGDSRKDRAIRCLGGPPIEDDHHAAIRAPRSPVRRFQPESPGSNRRRFQVLAGLVSLSLDAVLMLGMREVEAIPTPSPLDARTNSPPRCLARFHPTRTVAALRRCRMALANSPRRIGAAGRLAGL